MFSSASFRSFFCVSRLGGELIRRTSVDAKDSQSEDDDCSAAVVTRLRRGRGDKEMSVSPDSVECLTRDDIA